MIQFNLEAYKANPNQRIILQHYKEDYGERESWLVEEAVIVMDAKLAIRMPDTGYDTDGVVVPDGNDVRDRDDNLIGTLWLAEKGNNIKVDVEKLAKIAHKLPVGGVLMFSCDEDGDFWGIEKIMLFDGPVLVCGSYGGGLTSLLDIQVDDVEYEVLEFLKHALLDRADGHLWLEVTTTKK